ncbi:MAG: nucleotide exchange factor GrpE [Alphaproteobacteria bacterium]
MIEEKDEAAGVEGTAAGSPRMAANDQGNGTDNVAATELTDKGFPAAPSDRLAAVEAELADTKDRMLRALAETENVRRRLSREREDARKYAAGAFAKDLLSPIDNLHRALEAVPEMEMTDPRARSLRDGVAAIEREFLAAFDRHGLKRIDPKGERFDHNFHEAVFEAERPDVPAGTIVEVLQPGYVMHDRLLRPAMVGVARGGPKSEAQANGNAE